MWIGLLRHGGKTVSPVELIALLTVDDTDFTSSTDILANLDQSTAHWKPERGTVYPVLHRLAEKGLLIKGELDGKLAFKRSEKGTSFLRARFPEIAMQLEAITKYFETVAEHVISIDPIKSIEFLDMAEKASAALAERISQLKKRAGELVKEQGWREVQLE